MRDPNIFLNLENNAHAHREIRQNNLNLLEKAVWGSEGCLSDGEAHEECTTDSGKQNTVFLPAAP